jgi:hypothetical protein
MRKLSRFTAAAFLVGAAMVSVVTAAPANAVSASSAAVPAAWIYSGSFSTLGSCQAKGSGSGTAWQCVASSRLPGGYDLYLFQ